MTEETDAYGNVFIRIPKFYIKKTLSGDAWHWQITKKKTEGYYLPACFKEESTGEIYPYILVGKYNGSLSSDETKLESKSNKEVLVGKNISQFREYATNNGGSYQLLDVHVWDMLQVLFFIEYATLSSDNIMQGYTFGNYENHTIKSVGTKSITLQSGQGASYRVGQLIDIGTSLGGRQISKNLKITEINADTLTYELIDGISEIKKEISPNHKLYNVANLTGSTDVVSSVSGSPISNTDGESSMKYRGIENLYGNTWQFIDGINIKANRQPYVALDAKKYESDKFDGENYKYVGYTNATTNNYLTKLGYNANMPYVNLPSGVGTTGNSPFKDYYYQNTGDRMALAGGSWNDGITSGIAFWALSYPSSYTSHLAIGSRLVKTP